MAFGTVSTHSSYSTAPRRPLPSYVLSITFYVLRCLTPVPPVEQHIQEHQADPHGDGGVCDVEDGPVILVNVDIQEVHHHAVAQTVQQVACGAAQDQGQGEGC